MNLLRGAFCPGGEIGWLIRNPYLTEKALKQPSPDPKYISTERTPEE